MAELLPTAPVSSEEVTNGLKVSAAMAIWPNSAQPTPAINAIKRWSFILILPISPATEEAPLVRDACLHLRRRVTRRFGECSRAFRRSGTCRRSSKELPSFTLSLPAGPG